VRRGRRVREEEGGKRGRGKSLGETGRLVRGREREGEKEEGRERGQEEGERGKNDTSSFGYEGDGPPLPKFQSYA
jgi:hypothetical protein